MKKSCNVAKGFDAQLHNSKRF